MIPLLASKDFYIVKAKNSTEVPIVKTEQKNLNLSSIVKGDKISNATITFGKYSYNLDLSSGVNHAKPVSLKNGLFNGDSKNSKNSSFLYNIIKYLAIILAVILVFLRLRHLKRRKKTKLSRFINNLNSKR